MFWAYEGFWKNKNSVSRVGLELTIFFLQVRALIHYTTVAVVLNCIILWLGHTVSGPYLKAESENQTAARAILKTILALHEDVNIICP